MPNILKRFHCFFPKHPGGSMSLTTRVIIITARTRTGNSHRLANGRRAGKMITPSWRLTRVSAAATRLESGRLSFLGPAGCQFGLTRRRPARITTFPYTNSRGELQKTHLPVCFSNAVRGRRRRGGRAFRGHHGAPCLTTRSHVRPKVSVCVSTCRPIGPGIPPPPPVRPRCLDGCR